MRGSFAHAAEICGMMLAFQDLPVDSAMFYDARFGTSIYGSLFNPLTAEPFPAYYAFKAFNRLYTLGEQVPVTLDCNSGVYAVAATNGKNHGIMITRYKDDGKEGDCAAPIVLSLGLEDGKVYTAKAYLVDSENEMAESELYLDADGFVGVSVPMYSVLYLEIKESR
jgi:hypothetical protein